MKKRLVLFSFLCIAILAVSCTYHARKKTAIDYRIEERLRENNQAALVANEITKKELAKADTAILSTNLTTAKASIGAALGATGVSSEFLSRNQSLLGLPINNQAETVYNLLSPNHLTRILEEERQKRRITQETQWAQEKRLYEQKLQEMGAKYEEERNKSIVKRTWAWATGTFGLLGGIAFIVFCPAVAIPLLGRVAGWIVEIIPSIAGFFGLVGKKVFVGVAKGIGNARDTLKREKELAPEKRYTPAQVLALLDTELAKSTNDSHKKVIQKVRDEINL